MTEEREVGAERIKPYESESAKAGQVERMFDSIAPAYDLMNSAMTLGLHRRWRRKALESIGDKLSGDVLDVATGTGDVALEIARRYCPREVTGIDLSTRMLEIARRKAMGQNLSDRVRFIEADCLSLPFADETFDAVTVAYGVRNFERLADGYREMVRVLRPGGKLCVIELSEPSGKVMRSLYRLYTRTLIPIAGSLISGDSRAYSYLPQSIAACAQRDDMTALMQSAGLQECGWEELTFGAVCIYTGQKR